MVWVLLMKFLRASSSLAPVLSILYRTRMFNLLFIAIIFYIPYVLSFWVTFGGIKSKNVTDEESGPLLNSIWGVSAMVFRMALIDSYPFEVYYDLICHTVLKVVCTVIRLTVEIFKRIFSYTQ